MLPSKFIDLEHFAAAITVGWVTGPILVMFLRPVTRFWLFVWLGLGAGIGLLWLLAMTRSTWPRRRARVAAAFNHVVLLAGVAVAGLVMGIYALDFLRGLI